jgi:hypothetical protein
VRAGEKLKDNVLKFYSLAGLLGNGKPDLILNRITLEDIRCQKKQDKKEGWDDTCPSHDSSEYLPYSAHKDPVIKMLD